MYTCHDDDKLVTRNKDVSEHNRDCKGNSSAHMHVHVEGSWTWLSGLCNATLTTCIMMYCNPHAHAHYW